MRNSGLEMVPLPSSSQLWLGIGVRVRVRIYGRYTGDIREMYLEEVDDAHGVERERVPYLLLDPLAGAHVDGHPSEGALALLVLDRLLAQLVRVRG